MKFLVSLPISTINNNDQFYLICNFFIHLSTIFPLLFYFELIKFQYAFLQVLYPNHNIFTLLKILITYSHLKSKFLTVTEIFRSWLW